jgi:crossover junction endodeoxyribonuclease RusA
VNLIVLELPFPPSLNTYWRHARGRTYINKTGLAYRQSVLEYVTRHQIKAAAGDLEYHVDLYPPDRRRRDGDNFSFKVIWDSLTQSGCIVDDSLFKKWGGQWRQPVKGGLARIYISSYREVETHE